MRDKQDEPRFLNVRETASRLAVHENTIRNWVKAGILPSSRVPGSRFHRFDERDVERLRQQRGATVSSVEPERRSIGPELVDAPQLALWAASPDARFRFPELIRRLLSYTPGVTNISVRAEAGVDLPGCDGRAESTGTNFLPAGALWFEFGVGSNPKEKADRDFAKRRLDPVAPQAVFVFVTPRRWPRAADWEASRRTEGAFAGVKVIDADDLEGWLQITPPVHYWISEELGRRPQEAETLERWWSRFRSQTDPALPPALFLAGREEQRQVLADFLEGPPGVIFLQADWQPDAIAFVASATAPLGSPDSPLHSLVVSSPEAWHRIIQGVPRMILIPHFDDPDLSSAVARRHHIVIAVGQRETSTRGVVRIPRPQRLLAAEALREAGLEFNLASTLAALARRSMPAFVRRLARDPRLARPRWTQPPDVDVIGPLVLIGAWNENSVHDWGVVSRAAGQDRERIERALRHWLSTSDPPFVLSGRQWRVASPEEALSMLREHLPSDCLTRWRTIATEVLLERDPAVELDPASRPMAAILDKNRRFSSVLRRGIAEAVALLGSRGEEKLADGLTGSEHAGVVVTTILQAAADDLSGHTWWSLEDILPLLAEAAPDAFLDAVHDDLGSRQSLLATMFQDGSSGSWFGTSSPHTGLLWALETLCWSPEFLSEATRALALLHELDPGGRLGNRPLASLASVLVGWVRHSSASVEERVRAVRSICRRTPNTGWDLVMALWPDTRALATPPHQPSFRDWQPETQSVPVGDWVEFIRHLVDVAVGLADAVPHRWPELADKLGPLPQADRERVLQFLEAKTARPDSLEHDARLLLWERLHKLVSTHRRFSDADWSMADGLLERLETIAIRVEPRTSPERFGYLFDWHPDLPHVPADDHEAYGVELRRLRLDAVNTVLRSGSAAEVEKLALRSPAPSHLGWALAEAQPEELTRDLLQWLDSEHKELRETATSWCSAMLEKKGPLWLREVLGRPEMSVSGRRHALVLEAPPTREMWDELLEIDAQLSRVYWEGMHPWRVPPEDAEYAARELLAHGRGWAAVDLLARVYRQLREYSTAIPDLVRDALDLALTSDSPPDRSHSVGYEIGQLLDYLEESGADPRQVAGYEFAFFRLTEHQREPRALFKAMADDPGLFVDLVKRVYRGKTEPKRTLDEREAALAQQAWWVLQEWRELPGLRGDGTVDSDTLGDWVRNARLAFSEADRDDIGDEEIGRVLSSSPIGHDGIWPAEAVREIIETIGSTSIAAGIHVGRINSRGVTSRGPYDGGAQERQLAAEYREWSARTSADWPRTSRILRGLAEDYERDARWWDERAEADADNG